MLWQRSNLSIKELLRISQKMLLLKMNLCNVSDEKEYRLAGICHMRATNNKADNMQQVCKIVEMARKQCVDFLFLPECCDFIGENRKEVLELAEPLSGCTVEAYREFAKNNKMWISFGGLQESIMNSVLCDEKTDKIYVTHLVINSDGDIVATYRKLHLFDVDTPKYRFMESNVVSRGSEIVAPIDTPIGKIGVLICYDMRFPEVSTILRKFGAEILTYPATIPNLTGEAHWEIILRARAVENQCFVIAPAQIGVHNPKRQSYGHAMIIDPWGRILKKCKNVELDLAVAKIDLEHLRKVRQSLPTFDHRRANVYSLIPHKISDHLRTVDMNFGGKSIPSDTIFFTSKHSFAFTNIQCAVPGHVLISSKRSVSRLKDLTSEEAVDLFATALTVQKMLESFYEASASTVTIQDGEDAGQTVKHVHVHVMPRKKGDFIMNDEIYVKLNDQTSEHQRSISEMTCEADSYKRYIKEQRQYL